MPIAHPEFIKLSDAKGRPTFLNIAEIASIVSLVTGALVRTRDGSMFEVREGAEAIVEQVLGPRPKAKTAKTRSRRV